jgi:hypothetical protein
MECGQVERGARWETQLNALADPYRRQLLVALLGHNPQDDDDIDPLDRIVRSETDSKFLKIEMFHTHLPKLDDLGYIEWHRSEGTIHKGPNWDEIAPLLELIHDHRDELPAGWF